MQKPITREMKSVQNRFKGCAKCDALAFFGRSNLAVVPSFENFCKIKPLI
jgi:hypothetical protein